MADRHIRVRDTTVILTGLALWVGGLLAAILVSYGHLSDWAVGALIVVSMVGVALILGSLARLLLGREGVERSLYIESSALAFWAVVFAAFTYGLVDAFTDLPPVRMTNVAVFALFVWAVAHGARWMKYR